MAALEARTVKIPLGQLTKHLGCGLCGGMLRDAQTITECLHSFCKSCIYRHFLVQGSKQCPKCLVTLTARPITTLIPDQRLQDVVDRIFPEYKARDAALEKEFYEKHSFKRKESAPPVNETLQATKGGVQLKKARSAKAAASSASAAASHAHALFQHYTVEVYPQQVDSRPLPPLKRPFLQVDGKFKMFELRKFLQKHLALVSPEELELSCMGATVGPELSVHFIYRTIWQQQQQRPPLVLHYRLLAA